MRILKKWWYRLIGMHPGKMEMVHYWKTSEAVEGKLVKTEDGDTLMYMEGEKYPIKGFPRGHLLVPLAKNFKGEAVTLEDRIKKFGPFVVLKHEFKTKIFNDIHRKLAEGIPKEQIIQEGYKDLDEILKLIEYLKFDLMPPKAMCPAVREIHRAWTKVAPSERSLKLRDALCLILQEDDGYRYRVQWMAIWMPWFKRNPIKILDKCLKMVELGEVIRDMKDKIKLLRTILMFVLQDPNLKDKFEKLFKEINWKKVKITEAERYHFRGKYFKCDMDVLEY